MMQANGFVHFLLEPARAYEAWSFMFSQLHWFITLLLATSAVFLCTIEEWSNAIKVMGAQILEYIEKDETNFGVKCIVD